MRRMIKICLIIYIYLQQNRRKKNTTLSDFHDVDEAILECLDAIGVSEANWDSKIIACIVNRITCLFPHYTNEYIHAL